MPINDNYLSDNFYIFACQAQQNTFLEEQR